MASVVAVAAEPAAAEEIFPRGLTQERPRGKVSEAENRRLRTRCDVSNDPGGVSGRTRPDRKGGLVDSITCVDEPQPSLAGHLEDAPRGDDVHPGEAGRIRIISGPKPESDREAVGVHRDVGRTGLEPGLSPVRAGVFRDDW